MDDSESDSLEIIDSEVESQESGEAGGGEEGNEYGGPGVSECGAAGEALLADLRLWPSKLMTMKQCALELNICDPAHEYNGSKLDPPTVSWKKRPKRPGSSKDNAGVWRQWVRLLRMDAEFEEPRKKPGKKPKEKSRRKAAGGPSEGVKCPTFNASDDARFLAMLCDPALLSSRTTMTEGLNRKQLDAAKVPDRVDVGLIVCHRH
jgi:hypothetical protein